MPRKDSPAKQPVGRRRADDEVDTEGQSGYAAGGARLTGAGAWSGRANPQSESPGSGPVPNEGTLRTDAASESATTEPARAKTTTKTTSKRGRRP